MELTVLCLDYVITSACLFSCRLLLSVEYSSVFFFFFLSLNLHFYFMIYLEWGDSRVGINSMDSGAGLPGLISRCV